MIVTDYEKYNVGKWSKTKKSHHFSTQFQQHKHVIPRQGLSFHYHSKVVNNKKYFKINYM